jgi:glycosyltransferase involved in cell wall biosynthesis
MAEIAYLLKGYPRRSETFIASEIHRLEQLGVEVRLFVLKEADEDGHHPVVGRIHAVPRYLPDATSLREAPFPQWLQTNLPRFRPAVRRVARRRPGGLARAAAAAAAQSVRARRSFWSPPRKLYVKELLRATALADALLDEPEIHHVHAHFAHGTTTVAWLASIITGVPFSFTGHAKDIYAPSLNPAGLLRRKLDAARFAVTCTEANRRHLAGIAPGAAVHRLYHGLNADFTRLLAENGQAPRRSAGLRVLAVGRLLPKKGFDVLLRAGAIVAAGRDDMELAIAGESGEQEAELRALVEEFGLGARVCFCGPLGQTELFDEYRRASVLCAPSRVLSDGDRDGIPNVLVEAMACGLPVVATGISGIPELVEDGINGLLVAPDDPNALAEAILRIGHDPGLASRLGAAGRVTVAERFDGERLAAELGRLFAEAMR